MAIKPIDLQAMMPRAIESSRTTANENLRPAVEQNQFAHKIQRDVYNDQRAVIQTNRAEGSAVDKDGKGGEANRQGSRRGRRDRDRGRERAEQAAEPQSLIDIRL